MRAYGTKLISVAVIGVCCVVAYVITGSYPAVAQNPNPGSAPVSIASPLPLPVTGTVNVANTPLPVNATIVQSPPVTLAPALPGEPFIRTVQMVIADGTTGSNESISIPSGKVLLLEQVSARIFLLSGQFVRSVTVRPGLTNAFFGLNATQVPGQTDGVFVVSQQMKLYAVDNITFSLSRAGVLGTIGNANSFFSVSGYLVDQ